MEQIIVKNIISQETPAIDIRSKAPTVDLALGASSAVAALTAASAAGGPVLIPAGTYLIDQDVTCSAPLVFAGGKFSIASGKTLTINGPIQAVPAQLFEGLGTVAFGQGAVSATVLPQWWGAKGDGSTDDSAAFAGALAAVVTNGAVRFLAGTYVVALNAMSFGGKSVSLIGDNATFSLVAGTGTSAFDFTDSPFVRMQGIKFTTALNASVIFADTLTGYTETFEVLDCEFTGKVRLIENSGSTTQDPSVTPFGFGTFRYERNKALNVEPSHIKMIDTPIARGIIRNNDIHNFSYVYFSNGLTNEAANNAAMMARGHIVISDNVVVCDDDYYGAAGSSGYYYAFVLVENNTVVYERNHVEGMKLNASGWTCYDAYLSSVNVINKNNIFKNSANFYAASENNTLIKCKLDSSVALPTTKQVIGNSYVMESDWVARIGKTPADVWHKLMGIGVVNGGKVVIADNVFDLMMLDISGVGYAEDFTFSGNTILANGISPKLGPVGKIIDVRPFADTSTCSISDNCILIAGTSAFDFWFIGQGGTIAWQNLKVVGNVVDASFDATQSGAFMGSCIAATAEIRNNVSKMPHRYDLYDCTLRNAKIANNVFVGANTNKLRPVYYLRPYGNSHALLDYSGKMEVVAYRVLQSATFTPAASTKYTVAFEFDTATGRNRIEWVYELQYAAGVYTVVWTDSADNARSDVVGTTDGSGILVKTTTSGAGSLTLTAKFQNSATADSTYFQVYGFPTDACDYRCEIRSFEV